MRLTIKNERQLQKFFKNCVLFTAPALALFFFQLSQGVDFKTASGVAILALYGLLSDYFKKVNK